MKNTPDNLDPMAAALSEAGERFDALFELGFEGACLHSDGVIERANPALEATLGAEPGSLKGRAVTDLLAAEHRGLFTALMRQKAEGAFELAGRRDDGTSLNLEVRSRALKVHGRDAFLTVFRDVTARRRAEAALRQHAYFDAVTGLPNRSLLTERLDAALREAEDEGFSLAVMVLDLDRFKVVNDALGHAQGDALLRDAAERIQHVLRQGDTLARLGGDEFGVVITGLKRADDAPLAGRKVLEALKAPFESQGRVVHLAGCLGLAHYPEHGQEATGLIRKAELAMFKAKGQGKNSVQVYHASMEDTHVDRLTLEHELRSAIEQGELTLFYQPQVDPMTCVITGMEALVRWRHPQKGLVAPDDFIPLAEETRLILPMGELLLKQACEQGRIWLDKGISIPPISVNLSPQQFLRHTLPTVVLKTLAATRFPAELLDLEITESVAMQDPNFALALLNDLTEMKVTVSLDDFGKGYSSLAYLRRFPVSALKLDQSFIAGLGSDPRDAAIISAAITMGHKLGLKVVAEGVETRDQLAYLRAQACDKIQGFLFSRPLPPAQVEDLLRAGRIDLTN